MQPEGQELDEEAGAGLVVRCDAVVVGSGAGAGPCSALLAAAGLRVVVLEKGTFTPNHELSLTVLLVTFFSLFFGVYASLDQIQNGLQYIHDLHIQQYSDISHPLTSLVEGHLEGWQGAVDISSLTQLQSHSQLQSQLQLQLQLQPVLYLQADSLIVHKLDNVAQCELQFR